LFGAIWVVGGGVAWAIVFIAMAPKHDADFIFTEFFNNTGYSKNGWVFVMSFYNSIYGMVGTDGLMHLVGSTAQRICMPEEASNFKAGGRNEKSSQKRAGLSFSQLYNSPIMLRFYSEA